MPAPRVNPQKSGTDGWDDGVVYDGVPITVATEILQNGRKNAIRDSQQRGCRSKLEQ